MAGKAASGYDLVFVCGDDIPYDDTQDRSGVAKRSVFQKQIIADLIQRKIPFFLLTGSLEVRIDRVKTILARYKKYQSLAELIE